MPEPHSDEEKSVPETPPLSVATAAPPADHLDEEEKILEGRHDVNMPALLTKDVHGG